MLREVTIISLVNYSVKSVAKSKWSHNIMKVWSYSTFWS